MTARHSRRGFALVLALLALSVVGSICVGALLRARAATTTVSFSISEIQSELVLEGLSTAIRQWLEDSETDLSTVNWPARGRIQILNHESENLSISVEAIDLSGRLHVSRLQTFAMRGLPSDLQSIDPVQSRRIAASLQRNNLAPTLEQIVALGSTLVLDAPLAVFPLSEEVPEGSTACEWLTTLGPGDLNVHSAPPELLRAAVHGLNPTLSRRAVESRQRGTRVDDDVASALVTERNRATSRSSQNSRHVPLTTKSSALGFLISITHSGRIERWWVSLEKRPDRRGSQNTNWRIVERRRIDL